MVKQNEIDISKVQVIRKKGKLQLTTLNNEVVREFAIKRMEARFWDLYNKGLTRDGNAQWIATLMWDSLFE